MIRQKKILVAPLNWGLGHVTRCMPIIDELLKQGATLVLASDGRAAQLLKKEYPKQIVEEIPAYNITYKTSNMMFNIGIQIPKILRAIYQEKQAIQKLVDKYNIDIIIADNRYGAYTSSTLNIFMTHQLNIKIPIKWLELLVKKINHHFINKFDQCWVPDFEDKPNLAGELAHGTQLKNVKYLGVLSRMKYATSQQQYDAIIILSGPEPQRSILEKEMIQQAKKLSQKILIVSGKTEEENEEQLDNVKVVSYLKAKELNRAILASNVVISRSGYSTLMDLTVLEKQAILIPTPGQTEQEYLAQRFYDQGVFYTQSQDQFNLKEALMAVEHFTGFRNKTDFSQQLKLVVTNLLSMD